MTSDGADLSLSQWSIARASRSSKVSLSPSSEKAHDDPRNRIITDPVPCVESGERSHIRRTPRAADIRSGGELHSCFSAMSAFCGGSTPLPRLEAYASWPCLPGAETKSGQTCFREGMLAKCSAAQLKGPNQPSAGANNSRGRPSFDLTDARPMIKSPSTLMVAFRASFMRA